MAQTTRYAAVLAKMGAQRSQLLSESKLKTLLEAKNLTELAVQLRETSYEKMFSKVPLPLTSRKLERALTENLIETYIKLIQNSPKKAAAFLKSYLLRFEVENFKALIKAANANLAPQQKLEKIYLSAETFLNQRAVVEEASKAPDLRQTVNSLKKTQYVSDLRMAMVSYEEDGTTACFDVLMDKHFYEKLYDEYQNLPAEEKPHARPYVSMQNDMFVLLTLLRGKNLHYDPNWLRLSVPTKKFNLLNQVVEEIVVASDFDLALKIALESHYAKFFIKASSAEETLANAEKALNKALFLHAKQNRYTEIFNVGAVLAFLIRKEAEVHNLTAICFGVEAKLAPENILRQLLV